jgi:hypothetical protein
MLLGLLLVYLVRLTPARFTAVHHVRKREVGGKKILWMFMKFILRMIILNLGGMILLDLGVYSVFMDNLQGVGGRRGGALHGALR